MDNADVADKDIPNGDVEDLEALVVGAGFGGVYQLRRLRQEGYKTKLVDSASDYGGVWYWNRFPGARVDITIPHYEFSDPELWRSWSWTQRFPGSAELRAYFRFVAEKWDLRKDTYFSTRITAAVWNEEEGKWLVTAANGRHFRAKYFLLNTGFAAKRYIPDWKGIDRFQGTWVHPSYWPKTEPDLTGKRVAVIGTGSTGVQLSQQFSQVAGEFVLFQRTPNLALPMRQVEYAADEQAFPRENYTKFFTDRTQGFGGILINFLPRATFDDTPEQRQATYQKLWDEGDFHFWLGTYHDMMFSWDANKEAYTFWRDKDQRPKLKEMLAPEIQPHAFGCKRISLEIGFYEIFNQSNVSLVDVNATPVLEVTEKGIKTTEKLWEFDYVICATGFDAVTGGFNEIDIGGTSGQKLTDKWLEGVRTYLGLAVSQFPNMFFTYGPQAPTAFCNGPTCAELQGEWIVNVLNHMREKGSKSIDAEEQAESEWTKGVSAIANASLLPTAKSWYMADNIPGKVRQPLIYLGGVPTYYKTINDCAKNGYAGFNLK
ncbi:hypothetical protein LTR69_006248 [Exophiala sideris]|uniref:FAD/NAD(P)-binding domain-containing protein n=1 Tax=Exophiala sideris TaxID=1016849 RepID=A0ABR0JC95_9EURO|nr:hypothetical protein LTR69_006248 [Exophiala sideris]